MALEIKLDKPSKNGERQYQEYPCQNTLEEISSHGYKIYLITDLVKREQKLSSITYSIVVPTALTFLEICHNNSRGTLP